MSDLTVSVSPHIHSGATTNRIMRDVLIALVPALVASVIIFGARSALVVLVSIFTCVFCEWIFQKAMKKPVTIMDCSAAITGVLLAYNLPSTIPLWQAVFGGATAIILVKQLFGGLGKNFANPAITARIIMFLAFSVAMTTGMQTVDAATSAASINGVTSVTVIDGISSATPLTLLAKGATDELPSLIDMFLGLRGGSLGETSMLALLLGGIYLIVRRVITWHAPVALIATVFVFTAVLGQNPVYHILSGGLVLGAIFMATDYVTAPQTSSGRLIFGIGAGFFTVLFRVYGSFPEGVSFAILLMNILTPYINRFTQSKPLGTVVPGDREVRQPEK